MDMELPTSSKGQPVNALAGARGHDEVISVSVLVVCHRNLTVQLPWVRHGDPNRCPKTARFRGLVGQARCKAITQTYHYPPTMNVTARSAHATPVTCQVLRRSPSTTRARMTVLAGYSDERVTATLSGP